MDVDRIDSSDPKGAAGWNDYDGMVLGAGQTANRRG
jgi:hypothetical protein